MTDETFEPTEPLKSDEVTPDVTDVINEESVAPSPDNVEDDPTTSPEVPTV